MKSNASFRLTLLAPRAHLSKAHRNLDPHKPSAIIVGAGLGGIAAAIALTKKGYRNFIILEKAFDVGGTWRENLYPGCTSDVSVHYYSLSTDLKPDWEHTCEFAYNIHGYCKGLVTKYNLAPHIVYGSKVVSAVWNPSTQTYTVKTESMTTGGSATHNANVLMSAHGILHVPKYPNIPGIEDFKGTIMHSARWDPNLDLRGKRVAVLGNGGSACQLVPYVAKADGVQLIQFIRTRNWILPALVKDIHPYWRWAFSHIPFLARLYRWAMFWVFELAFILIFKSSITRNFIESWSKSFMRKNAPKRYQLEPTFPIGCRRIVFDAGYVDALHQPNVSLTEGKDIESVDANGIIMKDGEKIPVDVIACATGFVTDKFPYTLRGVDTTIEELYDKLDGPEAYLGTTVPGFPNFFMLNGPNTATGYTSVLFFTEAQLCHIMQLVSPILDGKITSVAVTQEANRNFNDDMQKTLKGMIFSSCASWYRAGSNGKNVSIFPGSATYFWWLCLTVNWSHYRIVGPDVNVRKIKKTQGAESSFISTLSAALVSICAAWWVMT